MNSMAIALLANAGVASSLIFIPNFAREAGASEGQIGLIFAAHSAMALLASFVFGRLADVRGRRRILQAGLLLSVAAAALQVLADEPVTIGLSRAFLGLALGMYPGALIAYAYEARERMGRFAAYGSIGWAVGNLAAGALAFLYPRQFVLVFAGSSALFFVAWLAALRLAATPEESLVVPRIPLAVIRRNLAVYATMLIRHTGANMIWVIFSLYLYDRGFAYWEIGLVTAVNPIVQAIISRQLDGYRASVLIPVGVALSAVVFVVAWATLYVGCLKFVTERNEERATAAGLLASTTTLAAILGPLAGGVISAAFGYSAAMYAAAGMCGLALLTYVMATRTDRQAVGAPGRG
jgi:MFS family permease